MSDQKHGFIRTWVQYTFTGGSAALAILFVGFGLARAEPAQFYLETFINGASTKLIAAFQKNETGGFSATPAELKELGLKLNGANIVDGQVFLSDISGLSYSYDENNQAIHIKISNESRLAKEYTAGKRKQEVSNVSTDLGAVLNYSINALGTSNLDSRLSLFEGVSAMVEARAFGKFGTLSSTFVFSANNTDFEPVQRLDTTWSYSDQERMLTYTAGDIISKGPSWARPARLGGLSVSRNFALRPDVITAPIQRLSGTAAVASTVDIYIDNVKSHSQKVDAGPFALANIPAVSGRGTARVVVRDAIGRESVTYSDFYSTPELLGNGIWDFSAEVGFPRGNFSESSFDYSDKPFFSGSFRYGWRDKATIDGHVEIGEELFLGGAGIAFPLAKRALISFSGAGSNNSQGNGFLIAGSLETLLGGVSINIKSQHTFGDFKDIASVSALDFGGMGTAITATEFPTAIDQISIGIPLERWNSSLSLSYIHTQLTGRDTNNIVSINFNKTFRNDMSFYASMFSEVDDIDSTSFFFGLSMSLGQRSSASVGATVSPDGGWRATSTYTKSMTKEVGSVGWRIQDQEGESSRRNASLSYRGSAMTIEGRFAQSDKALEYSAYAQGAIAINRAGVFTSNRIDDAFAVADVGAANVPVYHQNRFIGKTNARGKLLIPYLQSYEANKIEIDTTDLPINSQVSNTTAVVVPRFRSGSIVKFGVETQTKSAIVIIHDNQGNPLKPGTEGQHDNGEAVIVGFDGRAFIERLDSSNTIAFHLTNYSCQVEFDFQQQSDTQTEIGPLICK